MKVLIFALITALATAANAAATPQSADPSGLLGATPILICAIPVLSGSPVITLKLSLVSDPAQDFVIASLFDKNARSDYWSQSDKNTTLPQLAAGQYYVELAQDGSDLVDGAETKVAALIVMRQKDGTLVAKLYAQGNMYPMACKSLVPAPAAIKKPAAPAPAVPKK